MRFVIIFNKVLCMCVQTTVNNRKHSVERILTDASKFMSSSSLIRGHRLLCRCYALFRPSRPLIGPV